MSPTRGIIAGGTISPTRTNIIEYLTFSTQGNSADFGDLTEAQYGMVGASNAIRGVFDGGLNTSNNPTNTIDYITMATLGNAIEFGDLVASNIGFGGGAFASPTRAVFSVGNNTDTDYVQIMTTGNAVDWGDLRDDQGGGAGGCSNGHGGLG